MALGTPPQRLNTWDPHQQIRLDRLVNLHELMKISGETSSETNNLVQLLLIYTHEITITIVMVHSFVTSFLYFFTKIYSIKSRIKIIKSICQVTICVKAL